MAHRNHRDSTASDISLQFVDPAPVPDSSRHSSIALQSLNQPAPPPSASPPLGWASYLGLTGSGHSSVYYLTRLQKYSSYVFTVFTSIHITNTSLIPLATRSVSASEQYFLLTRPFYQSFPFEPLLVILPIATHVLAGLALRIHRRNSNLARYGAAQVQVSKRFENRLEVWPSVSWISRAGHVLSPLVVGHAFTNRLLPWIYEGGSSGVGLGFVSHGFARHPAIAWIGYVGLVGAAAGHFVWGAAKWNGWLPSGSDKRATRRWWTINAIVVAIAGLWMSGGLGIVGRGGKASGWIGKGYDQLYSRIPLLKL